jgi:hypothetical protein
MKMDRGGVARINPDKLEIRLSVDVDPPGLGLPSRARDRKTTEKECSHDPLSEFVLRHKVLVVVFWVAVFAVVAPVVDMRI